jgi:hypothetical protein
MVVKHLGTPLAIIIGATLIAASIMATNHWQIISGGNQDISPLVFRLNRWTGRIEVCSPDPYTMRNPNSFIGAEFACEIK